MLSASRTGRPQRVEMAPGGRIWPAHPRPSLRLRSPRRPHRGGTSVEV